MNNLLDILPGTGDKAGNYYFSDFGEPVVYAIIGFVVVFVGIVILIGIIWFIGFLLRKTNNFEAVKNIFKKKNTAVSPVENNNQSADVAVDDGITDAEKAAIIAAIMAFYESEEGKCQFTVRRIKKL